MLPTILSATTAVAVAGYATFIPRSSIWGSVISRGASTGNRIALTFDDGPTPGATDRILDILRQENVPATFFAIGVNAEKNPDLLRRTHAEGHLLANHSYRHEHYALFRGYGYWRDEFERTNALLQAVTRSEIRNFRPPMGIKTPIILSQARRRSMSTIAWTHRAHDGFRTTPEKIVERLTTNVVPGSILMIHDGIEPNHPRDPEPSIRAIRPLIENLKSRGFAFCRIDQLLERSDKIISPTSS
jgi:peptidoglycan-N-acetylglucosamine deacetylase